MSSTTVKSFAADPALPPVRVGLAAGPAVAQHGDYYGEVVNLAARLVKAGDASGIIVSDSVRQAVEEDFVFGPASKMALKGFDAPVAGFRLLRTSS